MSILPIDAPDYSGAPAIGAAVLQTRTSNTIPNLATQVYGPYFVGTGNLVATICNTTNQVAYTTIAYTWCSGPSLLSAIGINSFAYMGTSQTFNDLRSVLGPYLFIQVTNNTGASQGFQITVNLIATEATRGQVFGYLTLQNWNGSIGAGATATFNLAINSPGRAVLTSYMSALSCVVRVQTTANPTGVSIIEYVAPANNTNLEAEIILPNNDVQVLLGNAAAPAAAYVGSLVLAD